MKASGKKIKLHAQLSKFKVMNDEFRGYDRLDPKEKTYSEPMKIMEMMAKRKIARVDQARAIKPIDDMFADVDSSKKPGRPGVLAEKGGKGKDQDKDAKGITTMIKR